jgi:putative PIG3 family NAD(P)H quinone oxidoreductase
VSLPQRQSAIVIARAGGPEVLEWRDVAVPVPRAGEVLIEVQAAGVNRHDCNQRRRGPSAAHSDIPGLEVAGTIVDMGHGVDRARLGEAVCALVDGGGYAHYVLACADQTLPLPAGLGATAAAALPEAAFTVWHNFFELARLAPGEAVLLHGGTSGVGTLAIQVLSALGHAVYATCGTSAKCEVARALGARDAFSYRDPDWVGRVHAATQGRGVDVILDMSGAQHSAHDVQVLAQGGRLLHLSPGNGAELRVPLRAVLAKGLSIGGSLLRPLAAQRKALIARELRRTLWPLLEAGRVRPVVHQCLPLAQAAEAHRVMESGQLMGKLVLVPGAQAGADRPMGLEAQPPQRNLA